jgi:hypothetical protein
MAQEKLFRLNHFLPHGHPKMDLGPHSPVKAIMPYLIENCPIRWTKIPDHEDLDMLASRKEDVPLIGFRKNGREVYLHIFCNEFIDPMCPMQIVINMYLKFKLGKAEFQREEKNWIHTIPLAMGHLSLEEIILIHDITHSLFWTIYLDYKKHKGI